jgi:hypothetical protein
MRRCEGGKQGAEGRGQMTDERGQSMEDGIQIDKILQILSTCPPRVDSIINIHFPDKSGLSLAKTGSVGLGFLTDFSCYMLI